jgi:preprotein translocase subunit SecF
MEIFHNPNFNFVRWRWHAIALSAAVILIGLVTMYTKGLTWGVEFEGGTIVIVQFDQPVEIQQVRAALEQGMPGSGQTATIQRYGDPAAREIMIRVPDVGSEQGAALSRTAEAVNEALRKGNLGGFKEIAREVVGPIVGAELTRRGIMATVLALGGILAYIAMRFRFSFAVGAVAATIHDLLVTLTFLAIVEYDISLNVIAGILTITGYSVNDTIVVFDRVRENMRSMRRDSLEQIVNVAVNQTLARTVITAGTTLLAVLALFLYGGEVLKGFAFTMLVGIITGTYSTVFIAAAVAILWQGRKVLRAPAAAAPTPEKAKKASRKVRAS